MFDVKKRIEPENDRILPGCQRPGSFIEEELAQVWMRFLDLVHEDERQRRTARPSVELDSRPSVAPDEPAVDLRSSLDVRGVGVVRPSIVRTGISTPRSLPATARANDEAVLPTPVDRRGSTTPGASGCVPAAHRASSSQSASTVFAGRRRSWRGAAGHRRRATRTDDPFVRSEQLVARQSPRSGIEERAARVRHPEDGGGGASVRSRPAAGDRTAVPVAESFRGLGATLPAALSGKALPAGGWSSRSAWNARSAHCL